MSPLLLFALLTYANCFVKSTQVWLGKSPCHADTYLHISFALLVGFGMSILFRR